MNIEAKGSFDESQLENQIYANLKALGVNIDIVKSCSPTLSQLKQFHEGIISILNRQRDNVQAIVS